MDREEAIKRVKALNLNSKDMEALSTLASEIVESENERIRKELIAMVKLSCTNGDDVDKKIAWLEKQGRLMKALQISNARIGELIEKNYYLKEQFEKQDKNSMGISEATKQKLEDNLHEALEKETPESFNEFLEKQGEQKPVTDFSDIRTWKYIVDAVWTEKDGIGQYLDSPFTEEVAKKLQKRFGKIEQKPADKVEHKFKVGDWIVYNDSLYYIGNIALQRYYECLRVDGTVHTFSLDIDSKSHLWTIQDAKDGDVLAYNDGSLTIFRYRLSGLDAGLYMSHVLLTDKIEFKQTCAINNVHPATKEQRDTLFVKMKEAGYEWDAYNKELKNY